MKLPQLAAVLAAATAVGALPQPQGASSPPSSSSNPTASASSGSSDGGSSLSVPGSASTVATSISTAIPSPTVAVSSPLFSAAPPRQQPWCAGRPGSRIYCPGEILQTVQLAELYADSKTFVDKPTIASEDVVVAAFANVTSANTIEALVNWIDTYFAGEGLDVLPAVIPDFNETPGFLDYVQDSYIKGWIQQVHGYWRDLVRVNVVNESCTECVSSQIPLNRSFVVPGGRFRENYYWDSFFILEGLLTSGLQDLANNTINNYLDLIDDIGFIPNGGRIYYLNRSQPPLFTQMLYLYIKSTNDTSFLERAVRLNDEELQWWDRNNSITVTGPSGQSHFTHSYTVNNSAPRPESYAEDWQTVNGPIGGPYINLSTDLYSDLASGAESGYDYSAQPISNSTSFLSSLTSNAPTLSTQRASHQTLSKLLPPILFLCISFVISLTIMFYMVSSIPLKIPHNISEIKLQTIALRDYSRKGISEGLHVSAVLSALFVFKQAFSVPGSILVNILFGSLYGTYAATLCACLFTGVGSVLAYYMARLCAPLVERFFPRALATTKSALLSGSSSDLFSYLLLARLFPLLPYSALNIACGVLKVPVYPYFITLVLGSFPYNFVTTQLGDLLGNLANSAEAGNINAIWTWDLIFKLAVASILSAAPVIFKEQLKGIIGGSNDQASKPDLHALSPSITARDFDSIPLASRTSDSVESEQPYVHDSYASYEADNGSAPLLRRDRTDSSASEVLFAPALELSSLPTGDTNYNNKKHQTQWSFSWKNFRRSLNSNECASSEHSMTSAGFPSFTSHSTARTSLDEEIGDTDEENARDKNTYYNLQRRSSGSSYQSFASRQSHQTGLSGHSRPSSIDFSSKHGRRTASIESASSSPTVAQHNQFVITPPGTHKSARLSQEWDRF